MSTTYGRKRTLTVIYIRPDNDESNRILSQLFDERSHFHRGLPLQGREEQVVNVWEVNLRTECDEFERFDKGLGVSYTAYRKNSHGRLERLHQDMLKCSETQ